MIVCHTSLLPSTGTPVSFLLFLAGVPQGPKNLPVLTSGIDTTLYEDDGDCWSADAGQTRERQPRVPVPGVTRGEYRF